MKWSLFKETPQPEDEEIKDIDIVKEETHVHDWRLIAKTYGVPRRDIGYTNNHSFSEGIIQRTLFGVTTLVWECVICRIIRKEELLGSEGNRLDDILDQVESRGVPQYVQRSGITFVIGRYQQQDMIPLK